MDQGAVELVALGVADPALAERLVRVGDALPEARQGALGTSPDAARAAMRDELDEVREESFAVNDEELAPELYSIAAPVRNWAREVVAAVNLAADSSMIALGELVDALRPHLVSTANRISARMGYRRDDE